jgi:hypothetical protein
MSCRLHYGIIIVLKLAILRFITKIGQKGEFGQLMISLIIKAILSVYLFKTLYISFEPFLDLRKRPMLNGING